MGNISKMKGYKSMGSKICLNCEYCECTFGDTVYCCTKRCDDVDDVFDTCEDWKEKEETWKEEK